MSAVALAACSAEPSAPRPAHTATDRSAPPGATGTTVAGYQPGEAPPVPLLVVPDLSLVAADEDAKARRLSDQVGRYPGLTVSPVACDPSGRPVEPGAVLYGDGTTGGDGAGVPTADGATYTDDGDGTGSYDRPGLHVHSGTAGAGMYIDDDLTVTLDGTGAGVLTRHASGEAVVNNGDGSGSYQSGTVYIANSGDGSGIYVDHTLTIINNGDGTALVDGVEVEADPLAPVPPLGQFPTIRALTPAAPCGLTITVDSTVLFDFGQATLRADAHATLDSVAAAMNDLGVPAATVEGHTDAISDDAFNQTLSEQRADAVAQYLRSQAVTARLEAVGYGETRPAAPDEIDGKDNPAGRQLNRRVEIFVPQF